MPRSIYERLTGATVPPPNRIERRHLVVGDEHLITIATIEYGLEEYDSSLWRAVASANGVENLFTFSEDFRGKRIRIPPPPLPEFED